MGTGLRIGIPLVAGVGLMLAFVFLDSDRRAPSARGRGEAQAPRVPPVAARIEEAAEVSDDPIARSAVEPGPQSMPESHGVPAPSPYENVEEWRASKDAILEGELVAAQGIQDWHGWQVYITSFAPRPFLRGNKNKSAAVEDRAGTFREELPIGSAQVFWYHSAVGQGPTVEVDLERGLNSITLTYTGPDPRAAIFVDVSGDEPVTASQVSVTRNDTGQVFWAADFEEEGRFVISGLNAGAYTVKVERSRDVPLETVASPGERVRMEI